MTVVSDAMKLMTAFAPPAFALVLTLAACSSEPDVANNTTANVVAPEEQIAEPPPSANAAQNVVAVPTPVAPKVIGLEGLGDLKIGEAVPKGSSWAERGAQTGDACRTISSPDYPGVYAIVEGGKVARITVGQRSDVKLVEGVGVGSTEADVKKWFAGFRSEPHKYEDAPAKYLTAPNTASGDPAVRFEIGQDGKVKLLHVGTMPVLGYVEGCG